MLRLLFWDSVNKAVSAFATHYCTNLKRRNHDLVKTVKIQTVVINPFRSSKCMDKKQVWNVPDIFRLRAYQ